MKRIIIFLALVLCAVALAGANIDVSFDRGATGGSTGETEITQYDTINSEESATLTTGYDFSFGNGDVGANIAAYVGYNTTLKAVGLTCETAGTNTNVSIHVDQSDTSCSLLMTGNTGFNTCNYNIPKDSFINGYVNVGGSAEGCVLTMTLGQKINVSGTITGNLTVPDPLTLANLTVTDTLTPNILSLMFTAIKASTSRYMNHGSIVTSSQQGGIMPADGTIRRVYCDCAFSGIGFGATWDFAIRNNGVAQDETLITCDAGAGFIGYDMVELPYNNVTFTEGEIINIYANETSGSLTLNGVCYMDVQFT